MRWQPHLKMKVSNGKEIYSHNFMKSDPDDNEQIEVFNKLKLNFKPTEKITLSLGY